MAGGRVFYQALGIGSAVAGRKVATAAWRAAVGSPPPADQRDLDVSWREAAWWAATSGAIAGVLRFAVTRKVAEYQHRSTAPPAPARRKR